MSGKTYWRRRCVVCQKPLKRFELLGIRRYIGMEIVVIEKALCPDSIGCSRTAEGFEVDI